MDEKVSDISVLLAQLEQLAKSNTRRIEKLELQTDATHDIASSIKLLVAEQKHQTETIAGIKTDIDKLFDRLEQLEHKPGKRWEGLIEKAIWAVCAAVIAFLLSRIGL